MDLQKLFDTVEQDWLICMIQHRVQDQRFITLIKRWMRVGVDDEQGHGVPQEAVILSLLAYPDKAKLIRFGRCAASQSAGRD
jgi:RNA-directed DNA polymerase